MNSDLVTSKVTSQANIDLIIVSNGISIESGGNITMEADKLTVETNTMSRVSLLESYMDIMKKQVTVTSSYIRAAMLRWSWKGTGPTTLPLALLSFWSYTMAAPTPSQAP